MSRRRTPKSVQLVMAETPAREAIELALRGLEGVSVSIASKLPLVQGLSGLAGRADILVLDVVTLHQLLDARGSRYHRLARKTPAVLALSSEELLEASDLLELVDAWLFTDVVDLDQLMNVLVLAEAGYTAVPEGFVPAAKVEQLRVRAFRTLAKEEQRTLLEMVSGKSNPQLAANLGVPEGRMKVLVRNVLRKLHFRNRTQAGIFAARYAARLSERFPEERVPDRRYSS